MENPSPRRLRRHHHVAILVIVAVAVAYAFWARGDRSAPPPHNPPPAAANGPGAAPAPSGPASAPPSSETASGRSGEPSPVASEAATDEAYEAAHERVKEARGSERVGLAARVTVPPELQHYSDRRRFLAVQMADSHEEQYNLPQDEGDLVAMLKAGTLVEMPRMGADYVLYDVGQDASDDPMAAYDPDAHRDIPLFPSAEALDAERAAQAQLAKESPSARVRAAAVKRGQLLATYYDDPARRDALLKKGADVAALAADFGGQRYDPSDPEQRARLEERLLSLTRPAARDVLLDLAREYHQKFGRLLPVTSLVRTERYQRRLSRVNANATHVETPPHTTGCAFDISYRYMAADEQQFLMDRVAQLEDEGHVESLRERRNHIHIFVFQDGKRPPEELIAQYLDDVDASHGIVRGRTANAGTRAAKRAVRGARAR